MIRAKNQSLWVTTPLVYEHLFLKGLTASWQTINPIREYPSFGRQISRGGGLPSLTASPPLFE
jgi:hypothetical protein